MHIRFWLNHLWELPIVCSTNSLAQLVEYANIWAYSNFISLSFSVKPIFQQCQTSLEHLHPHTLFKLFYPNLLCVLFSRTQLRNCYYYKTKRGFTNCHVSFFRDSYRTFLLFSASTFVQCLEYHSHHKSFSGVFTKPIVSRRQNGYNCMKGVWLKKHENGCSETKEEGFYCG